MLCRHFLPTCLAVLFAAACGTTGGLDPGKTLADAGSVGDAGTRPQGDAWDDGQRTSPRSDGQGALDAIADDAGPVDAELQDDSAGGRQADAAATIDSTFADLTGPGDDANADTDTSSADAQTDDAVDAEMDGSNDGDDAADTAGIGSCAGRCDVYDAAAACQCDSYCVTAKDCCPDYQQLCVATASDVVGTPDTTADATTIDSSAPDSSAQDSAGPDSAPADTGTSDTQTPDGWGSDTGVLDVVGPDTLAYDTTAMDTAKGDAGGFDTGELDASSPDAGSPDASPQDTTPQDVAPVDAGCTNTSCDDGNPCTGDTCQAGTCSHKPLNGSDCDDGKPCTSSACESGSCVGKDLVCDDNDPCTKDACDPGKDKCVHTPIPSCGLADLAASALKPKTTIFPVLKQVSVTYTETNVGAKATGPYHNVVALSDNGGAPKASSSSTVAMIARPSLVAGASRTHTVSFKVPPMSSTFGGDADDYVHVVLDAKHEVNELSVSAGGKDNFASAKVDIRATDLAATGLSPSGKWVVGKGGSANLTWVNKLKLPASTYGSFKLLLLLSTSSNPKSGSKVVLWQQTTTQSTSSKKATFQVKAPKFSGSKKTFWLHFIVDSGGTIPEPSSSNNFKHTSVTVYAP